MNFRNIFVFMCVAVIIGTFLYVARPEWFSALTAKVRKDEPEAVTRKVQVIIPVPGNGSPMCPDGTDVRHIIDLEEDGLPSRVNPYILVVNSNDKTFRYYRLTSNVKSASLRSSNAADAVARNSRVLNSNGPIQLEVWVPVAREVTLDVEYTTNRR